MKILSLDIETSGLDPWRDQIYMCGIYDGESYFCCRTPTALHKILDSQQAAYEITGHRTDFDIKFLQVQDWLPMDFSTPIHDSRIIGSLLKQQVPKEFLTNYEVMRKEVNKSLPTGVSHRKGSPLSLKVMAPWYLKVPPFWETPDDHNNEEYNELDCRYAYRLRVLLGNKLLEEGSWDFYMKRMLEWQKMLRAMEIKGIGIDKQSLEDLEMDQSLNRSMLKGKLDQQWVEERAEFRILQKSKIYERYGEMLRAQVEKGKDLEKSRKRYEAMADRAALKVEDLNYASDSQMLWLLRDQLELDVKDAQGKDGTGKAILNRLAQSGREDVKTFLEWRKADKILTMYIPTYENKQVDGVIHCTFNGTGTRTGRLSCSSPNLQQVPPILYQIFKPRPGHRFINYDLSGIEAALIALYSGDIRLYEILEQGESIHDHNAKAMFNLGCPISDVAQLHVKERKTVKNIGFACFYGAGWRRISQVFAAGGFPISDQEAKEKLKLLKSYYPKAFEFHKEITEVFESGETVKNLLGRPITIQAHENAYMQGFNRLIQSSASDLNLYACEKWWKMGKTPLLLIHDCIIGESKVEEAEEDARLLVRCMTDFKLMSENGPIQIRAEGGVSDAWEK